MKRAIIFSLFAFALAGCPRETTAPDEPMSAMCETHLDCVDSGPPCGLVRQCVDGFCETEPSLVIECR